MSQAAISRAKFSYHVEAIDLLARNKIAVEASPAEVYRHVEGIALNYANGALDTEEALLQLANLTENLASYLHGRGIITDLAVAKAQS